MKCLSCGLLCLSLALFLSGCAGDGGQNAAPPLAKVKGTVTLDGKPMAGGEVRFNLAGQVPKILPVKDGTFAGEVFSGKNRVDVVWEKPGQPNPMKPDERIPVNVVSDKYSGINTPFNPDIPPSGSNDLKFEVKSARR